MKKNKSGKKFLTIEAPPQQLACYWIRSKKFLTIGYQASNQRQTLTQLDSLIKAIGAPNNFISKSSVQSNSQILDISWYYIYIYIILRPWSTAQISQEQQDLGSWVVISFRVRDPKSDGCEVLPRMDFWGPSSKQFRGPQKKRSPTSRVIRIVIMWWALRLFGYDWSRKWLETPRFHQPKRQPDHSCELFGKPFVWYVVTQTYPLSSIG